MMYRDFFAQKREEKSGSELADGEAVLAAGGGEDIAYFKVYLVGHLPEGTPCGRL
jgi:hypothetical protein